MSFHPPSEARFLNNLPFSRREALAGIAATTALPLLSTFPLAHQALLTRGLRRRSPAGLAAFGLHALQPWLAFSGSALRPRDLRPARAAGRLGRQSRRTWRER